MNFKEKFYRMGFVLLNYNNFMIFEEEIGDVKKDNFPNTTFGNDIDAAKDIESTNHTVKQVILMKPQAS